MCIGGTLSDSCHSFILGKSLKVSLATTPAQAAELVQGGLTLAPGKTTPKMCSLVWETGDLLLPFSQPTPTPRLERLPLQMN